jgi:recombination protein RecR
MSFSPLITQLINALRILPGVGPKTAQRMALSILVRNRSGGKKLADILCTAIDQIGYCEQCRNLSENKLCAICSSTQRDRTHLCVVESPMDVMAIEAAGNYRGLYFVLMGHLSPIDGIGPDDIGVDRLLERLQQPDIEEVILATNPTVEGEATAHYIAMQVKNCGLTVSRIAHGIPMGGELEFVDGGTLIHAFNGRKTI